LWSSPVPFEQGSFLERRSIMDRHSSQTLFESGTVFKKRSG
jgi:hypothetical protein